MSQPDLAEQADTDVDAGLQSEAQADPVLPTQKQKTSIYTVMLIISFVCLLLACILLYVELRHWGSYPWWNVNA